MRLKTWVTLGLQHDLAGNVTAISAENWRAFRDELKARPQVPEPPDKM